LEIREADAFLALGPHCHLFHSKDTASVNLDAPAAEEAAGAELKRVHQCHTQRLFETVDGITKSLFKSAATS
jgi:hypothetical protein